MSIKASGRFDLPFTCAVNGVDTAPTGTPTGVLVKNGTDLGTTVTVTMSAAQGIASCTIPSDAVDGDRFCLRVSAVVSGTTYERSGPSETVVNSVSQTGDSYARIGAAGAGLTSVGDTRLANLDATISSRAATGAAMTLTSGERITLAGAIEAGFLDDMTGGAFLAGVMAQIEALFDSGADVPVVTIADTVAGAVRMELATELARLDAAVSSRLATSGYTAPLDAAGVRTAVGLASANLDTQLGDLPTAAEAATAVWAAGTRTLTSSGSGIGEEDIADIVDGISEALTAPGFAASVSIQEGTYATVADVEARLSAYGVTNLADLIDPDGTRDSQELGLVEVAIEYANSVIDEHIVDLLHNSAHRVQSTFTRPSGNAWLRDRCVDIACYRIATLGGRSPSDVLRLDYESALDRLAKARNQQIRIPHLQYTAPTRPYAMEMGGKPTIVRTRGT